ncbi:hypothetical protein LINPERPRIM_LOCUS31023 [Linum perenne]
MVEDKGCEVSGA